MNELIKIGKKRTILISLSVLLVSLHTIYLYQSVRPEVEIPKLIQQIIRFSLTIVLLVFAYKGKKWARSVATVLFSLGALGAIIGLFNLGEAPLVNRIPLFVMAFVYLISVYHFGLSKSYKVFLEYQKARRN